eukprot:g8144.t1
MASGDGDISSDDVGGVRTAMLRAACLLQACARGYLLRRGGVRYERTFLSGRLGLELEHGMVSSVLRGGQAQQLRVRPGSAILRVGGRRVIGDLRLALLLATAPRPLRVEFGRPGTAQADLDAVDRVYAHTAAIRLQTAWRGKQLRRRGIEYTVEFGADTAGDLGFHLACLTVFGVAAGSPAAGRGVRIGSVLLAVGGKQPVDDAHAAELLAAAPRPALLAFLKPSVPRARTGQLFKLRGGEGGHVWTLKDVAVDERGKMALRSVKRKAKSGAKLLRLGGLEIVAADDDFKATHAAQFSFVEHAFMLRPRAAGDRPGASRGRGANAAPSLCLAARSVQEFAAWFVFFSAVLNLERRSLPAAQLKSEASAPSDDE